MSALAHSTIPSQLTTAAAILLLSIVSKHIQTELEVQVQEGCQLMIHYILNNGNNALPIAAVQIRFMLKINKELVDAKAIKRMQIKFLKLSSLSDFLEG